MSQPQRTTTIRMAAVYFAMVFGIGFVLGTLRVVLLVPKLGARAAELLEIPVMLVMVFLIGRWIGHRCQSRSQALSVGMLALIMLLGAEVGLAFALFGKTPAEALLEKDPVSGTAYYLALMVFAAMPFVYLSGRRT